MGAEASNIASSTTDDAFLENIVHKQHEQIKIDPDTAKKRFQELRSANTIDDSLKIINNIGICLNDIDPSNVPPQILDGVTAKILFIVCNTYTKPKYVLGVGPLNDSITVAVNHLKMGYKVVFLYNSTPTVFKKWLKFILRKTESDLTIFYTGHGCSIKDKSGDESDGYDEVMLFDAGYVLDDELASHLAKYAHGQKILLLTDCCHSGSMWDLQSQPSMKDVIPKNIISISAAKDDQTAKQTKMKATDQGIFTYYFWELFNNNQNITPKQMEKSINPYINRFKQHFTIATTSPELVDEPIFPHRERAHAE